MADFVGIASSVIICNLFFKEETIFSFLKRGFRKVLKDFDSYNVRTVQSMNFVNVFFNFNVTLYR